VIHEYRGLSLSRRRYHLALGNNANQARTSIATTGATLSWCERSSPRDQACLTEMGSVNLATGNDGRFLTNSTLGTTTLPLTGRLPPRLAKTTRHTACSPRRAAAIATRRQ